jgi:hypothetical protein
VTVEKWDAESGRWLLYLGDAEHQHDCKLHPYERIPKRVFLDTNVVNLLVSNAEQIFEQEPIPGGVDRTRAQDIEALMHVFYFGMRGCWDMVTSQKTIDEISQTPEATIRDDLLEYAMNFVRPVDDDVIFAEDFGRRLMGSPFVSFLPDPADQMLLGHAIGYGCDVFCTRDRRTIVRYRDDLGQLPLRILTPLEWWKSIKPWAALLG